MSVAYQERVAAAFAPLPEPHPADETLLPRQRPALGGAATRQPFRPDQQADRDVARAVAVLRARQHSTLSASFAAGNRGPIESQPGTSRLARGLSSLADSVAGGAAWLWNSPDPGVFIKRGGGRVRGAQPHAGPLVRCLDDPGWLGLPRPTSSTPLAGTARLGQRGPAALRDVRAVPGLPPVPMQTLPCSRTTGAKQAGRTRRRAA